MGDLAKTPAPLLILGLRRERFSGVLAVSQGALRLRISLESGMALRAESSRPEDGLAERLVTQGLLDEADLGRIKARCAAGDGELKAIAQLRKLSPRDLVGGIRAATQACLQSLCGFTMGSFSLEPAAGGEDVPLVGVEPAGVAFETLARWRPHELLDLLGDKVSAFPEPADDPGALEKLLPATPDLDALRAMLNGRMATFAMVKGEHAARAGAALVVYDQLGLLAWQATPREADPTLEPVEAEPEEELALLPEIEIAVAGGADGAAAAQTRARTEEADPDHEDPAQRKLREEVEGLLARLSEIDHYELLGVARDVPPGKIKRAYLKLAKRLHPDAIAQKGLHQVKEAATEVFAQITRAHTTLSDPDARRDYDATLEGHAVEDADRIAQAEMLYRKAEILMKAGNFLGAVEFLEPSVELWPEEADYQGALGWCLFKKSPPELERASEHLEKASALAPQEPLWRQRIAVVEAEIGRSRPG